LNYGLAHALFQGPEIVLDQGQLAIVEVKQKRSVEAGTVQGTEAIFDPLLSANDAPGALVEVVISRHIRFSQRLEASPGVRIPAKITIEG
jgi:hypothetical protein